MMCNINLTDMENRDEGVFRRDKLITLKLSADRFTFEPEITAKAGRAPDGGIYEVPISYSGRTYAEGKKIGWRDAVAAIVAIVLLPVSPTERWVSSSPAEASTPAAATREAPAAQHRRGRSGNAIFAGGEKPRCLDSRSKLRAMGPIARSWSCESGGRTGGGAATGSRRRPAVPCPSAMRSISRPP